MAFQQAFEIRSRGRGATEITDQVALLVGASGVATGIAHVFVRHTSCALTIIENAGPAARSADIAADAGNSVTVPVDRGELQLGKRQGIYLSERRTAAHTRSIVVTVIG